MSKYIFITGGVVSGLGKGITAASIGRLLMNRGLSVTVQKLDPYINVDPGTMSPYEHGEVFVTEDGAETDLDIGHYERFLGRSFSKNSNHTMGRIYSSVINKERKGDYLGKTVQVIPHVTNEVKSVMRSASNGEDVVIIEIGGTVGDIEQMVYVEAIRQFRREIGIGNSLSVHVTLVPYMTVSGEIKTKPTQSSVRELSESGVFPDIIVCRTDAEVVLDLETRSKIAMFCSLDGPECVIHNRNCGTIYEVPLLLKEQKIDDIILEKLGLTAKPGDMKDWRKMVDKILLCGDKTKTKQVKIALVGKYAEAPDAYMSIMESIRHACWSLGVGPNITLVDSVKIEQEGAEKVLKDYDAIVVGGGFGVRGVEGKILTAKYAREKDIPYFGICLGMQITTVEFARNVVGLSGAHSTEMDADTKYPVIYLMEGQSGAEGTGGTMRLGLYKCEFKKGSKIASVYKKSSAIERHRHRYEFNCKFRDQLQNAGMTFSGVNVDTGLVEAVEITDRKFFIAVQYHPEFASRPFSPHPLFVGLIEAVKK